MNEAKLRSVIKHIINEAWDEKSGMPYFHPIAATIDAAIDAGKIAWKSEYPLAVFLRLVGLEEGEFMNWEASHSFYDDEMPVDITGNTVYLGDPADI